MDWKEEKQRLIDEAEYFNWEEGENTFVVLNIKEKPKITLGDYGEQANFLVTDKLGGKTKKLVVGLSSLTYRILVDGFVKGHNQFTIIKMTDGKKTKYKMKETSEVIPPK